jgi:hypothetical protein
MGIFGGDKWRNTRDDLAKVAKAAKEYIPSSVDDAVRLLFGAGPADRQAYQPYLAYLNKGDADKEVKKYPQDVVDACCLRLLCVATDKLELIAPGWKVALSGLTLEDLAPSALPLLKQLTDRLVEQNHWEILLNYRVGEFLSTIAHYLLEKNVHLPDLRGAMARGLYAQGAAALNKGDKAAAKKAWGMAKIYAKESNDPALALCQQGLAKLG